MKVPLGNKIPFQLLQDLEVDLKFDLGVDIPLSYYPYTISAYAASILGKRGLKRSLQLENLIEHLKKDVEKLEKSIIGSQGKKVEYFYDPLESMRIEEEFELYEKMREKIGLPKHSTFRYEKVKCSKRCIPSHNHQYFYAYFTDPTTKKLKQEDHEGNEITVSELVDRYLSDPELCFNVGWKEMESFEVRSGIQENV